MRTAISGSQFRKDVKLAQRRGKDMEKLRTVLSILLEGKVLPAHYKDHPLRGEWKDFRDCHIEADWLLIYKIDGNALIWSAPALIRTFSNDTINPLAKSADFPLSTRPFTNLILKSGTPRRANISCYSG